MRFTNRQEAGRELAQALKMYLGTDSIIYALPRGGVIVGFEIAQALGVPLDLVITRKIGHPDNPEYAICAVTEDGSMICNEDEKVRLDPEWLKQAVVKEIAEAARRRRAYLGNRAHINAKDRIAIIVDDGIATGLTMEAAIASVRKEKPKTLVVAAPVAPHDVVETLRQMADEVVMLEDDENYLGAVGAYYKDFPQVSDKEVVDLLGM